MSPTQPAEPKPTVTKNSSEFNREAYASLPPGELVVFAVQVLQADGAPAQPEDIVSICFRFFPHSFALKNYFYWPDSALVTRRLHDAKEKGLLKGSAADGFEVKVQGRQAAKHVAKALGVSFPIPPKVEAPAPVEKKTEPETPVKIEEKAAVPVAKPQKKKPIKKAEVRRRKTVVKKKPAAVRKEKPSKLKPKAKIVVPVVVKRKPAPKPKIQKKVSKPAPKEKAKVKPEVKTKAAGGKAQQPRQLTMPLTPPAAWKKAQGPASKPRVREEAKLVRKEAAAPVIASKEEKNKAAKVVKQIERSDAYQLYRRNGRRARIGEFDFRNMLFATMESSAETLNRNLELFKRYSGIHYRADLVAFLEFCEGHFAPLLKAKHKR